MLILGIDTSQDACHIGITCEGKELFKKSTIGGRYVEGLLLEIDEALHSIGKSYEALDAVAVCVGPGSFTGVRNALSTAQGLAFPKNIPVCAVSTLLVYAWLECEPDISRQIIIGASVSDCYLAEFKLSGAKNSPQRTLIEAGDIKTSLKSEILCREVIDPSSYSSSDSGGMPALAACYITEKYLKTNFLAGMHVSCSNSGLGLRPIYVKGVNALTIKERQGTRA